MDNQIESQNEEFVCGKPCDPDTPCDECDSYWQTMVSQGLWNTEKHRWTDKGWTSITRSF